MTDRRSGFASDEPSARRGDASRFLYALAALSLAAYIPARFLAVGPGAEVGEKMRLAATTMDRASRALAECRRDKGLAVDSRLDPNGTGLIGLESSSLTTSLGNLGAKRTTTNPDFAALIVRLLAEAGVGEGDAVAIGASSSFPALIVAALSAAEALKAEPLLICSLGASQYGANDPAFHWLDMMDCLKAAGVFDVRPLAVSIGGDADSGRDMEPGAREALLARVFERDDLFLEEPALEKNVSARLRLYGRAAGGRGVKSFINIGGSWANMGTDSRVLELKPGLARTPSIPPPARRGVLFEMARRGVPVIHLLFIRGLAEKYGLPWDPRPLPKPGGSPLYDLPGGNRPLFLAVGIGYVVLAVLAVLGFSGVIRRRA